MALRKTESKRNDGNKYLWHRQLYLPDGRRTTVRLGNLSEKVAYEVDGHITHLIECRKHGTDIREKTEAWLHVADEKLVEKLAYIGLCEMPDQYSNPTWEEQAAAFLARKKTTVKPGTYYQLKLALDQLTAFLPKGIKLKKLTSTHAVNFWHSLLEEVGENTAKKRLARVREVLHEAVEMDILVKNPFVLKKLPVAVGVGLKKYVPEGTIEKVLDSITDPDKFEWKLLLAFGRYVGCRMPSEIKHLAWDDIDWEANTITLTTPKTEKQGKRRRKLPLFEEIKPLLRQQLAANPDEAFVFSGLRHHTNTATNVKKMVVAAGVKPWPKFWNSLRASRETDLMDEYGLRRACAWIGNTVQVAERNYRLLKDTDYQDVGQKSGAKNGAAQHHIAPHSAPPNEKTLENQGFVGAEATRHGLANSGFPREIAVFCPKCGANFGAAIASNPLHLVWDHLPNDTKHQILEIAKQALKEAADPPNLEMP